MPKKKRLQLTLKTAAGRDLFGEVAQARFAALALSMGAEGVVKG
jgi:exopolyphosphatase/guanosine-5'-triphosphate,3'-diphosphate pyrophosphatase